MSKLFIVAGYSVAAALAWRRWRVTALSLSLVVTITALRYCGGGLRPDGDGDLQLWALLLVPFIVVLGTLGDVRVTLVAGSAVLVGSQAVAHAWALEGGDRLLSVFVSVLGALLAAAVALMLNEAKRQTLHDQRAAERVSRRLVQSQRQHAQAERLAVVGKLAAAMAHEINNPLSYALANVRFVTSGLPGQSPEEVAEFGAALSETEEGLRRIQAIVERMSAFRAPTRALLPTNDLRGVLERFVATLPTPGAAPRVRVAPGSALPAVALDEVRLNRVLSEVVVNALDASSSVAISPVVEGDRVRLLVDDDGPGFDPAVLPRLFEPFVSSTAGLGTLGLSLALARELVRSVGGDVLAANRPEGGARVIVELPLAS